MKKTVFLLMFAALAIGLAQDVTSAIGPLPAFTRDPRVLKLRAEQEAVKDNPAKVKELENRIQEIYLESQPAMPPAWDAVRPVEVDYKMPQLPGPDVMIDTGAILATAADYEMDGTMYVAWSRLRDSLVLVVKSTNHGNSWQYVTGFITSPKWPVPRLGMVVGAGDSAFIYVIALHPSSNGDAVCVRTTRDGSDFTAFWVSHDTATINNFTFCRDYVNPYYLYCIAGNDDHSNNFDDHVLRSTNFGKNWAQTNQFRYLSDGSYQAGAGAYLYVAGYYGSSPHRGWLCLLVNTMFGAPDSWREAGVEPDTFEVEDPVMAPSFVTPPQNAVVWTTYSHNHQNSGDWDIKFVYSTDAGNNWSSSYFLSGSSAALERFSDIKPYTDPGNPWMNASYISEQSYRTVYRHYCQQSNPVGWSDTLRINTHSAGTGQEIRPLLVYSPGSPGTGAGCLFVGAGLRNLYWNAPWTGVGAEEQAELRRDVEFRVLPNPMTGRAALSWAGEAKRLTLFDASGRVVREYSRPQAGVVWDRRDEKGYRVGSGVYFARVELANGVRTRQIVVE
ncbi:MAG: T9SS type A sorting domain-containing protein [candidate division WOR-3 bacterium]